MVSPCRLMRGWFGAKVGLVEVHYGSEGVNLVNRGMGLRVEKPSLGCKEPQ